MVGYCSRAPFAVLLFAISVLVYVPAYVSAGMESQILATTPKPTAMKPPPLTSTP
jgi:hypothetical protein